MAEKVAVDALQPGMVILRVTAQNGPVKIRKSGLVSSTDMIRGLAEMGVLEVEIDPAQTVELEPDAATAPAAAVSQTAGKSLTRQLLGREAQSTSGFDHQLSEQFNRSLFLPSVQELPGTFQVHLKKAMTMMIVVIGGFGIGWTTANADKWLTTYQEHAALSEASQAPVKVAEKAVPDAPENTEQVDDVAQQSAEQTATQPSAQSPIEVAMVSQDTASQSNVEEPEPLVLGYQPEAAEQVPGEDSIEQVQDADGLSPELVARFRDAIAELDNEPERDYTPTPTNKPDVPMVHELPAWILTDLPSMAFSAHMYASDPAERWIRVNGIRVEEGGLVDEGLRLVSIEPQHVVMNFKGETFSMAALTDW